MVKEDFTTSDGTDLIQSSLIPYSQRVEVCVSEVNQNIVYVMYAANNVQNNFQGIYLDVSTDRGDTWTKVDFICIWRGK